MDKVNTAADTLPARFLHVAASLAGKPKLLRGKLVSEVVLTVNGEEVPFEEALLKMETELLATVEKRAMELALDAICDAGLKPALDSMNRARRDVQRALSVVRHNAPDETPHVEPT